MLKKIKNALTKFTKAVGLEIVLLPDMQYEVNAVWLIKEKAKISIEKKQQWNLTTLEGLTEMGFNEYPVSLVVNGRGVLHKKLPGFYTDQATLVQAVLPNAKGQDFYIQQIASEKHTLASMIRRDTLDDIVTKLQAATITCVSCSLGGNVITSLRPIIPGLEKNWFEWHKYTIEMDRSGTPSDCKMQTGFSAKQYFTIGTEKLEDQYLLTYAAAFALLTEQEPVLPFVQAVIDHKEEFQEKQLFKKTGVALLGFFLSLLLLNFVLFANFSSANQQLLEKENKYSNLLSQKELLLKETNEKKTFLSEAGWLQASRVTFYADRIAATVPVSVRLTEFSVNPLKEKESKEFKKEVFNNGLIFLKGISTKPTELNDWLGKIKTIDRIQKVKLEHYFYDSHENKGSFSITIEIAA